MGSRQSLSNLLICPIVDAYIHRLHRSIDHALAVSYRRNLYDGKTAFVAHISLVKGIPFYGYHVGYRFFLKIYMLNPLHMTRLADLLRQGAVMKKALQPYESHVQYLLQWMCDYNLYGCAYVDCNKVKFRSPIPKYEETSGSAHQWNDRSVSTSMLSEEENLPRQSHCSIEVDICVQHILNRLDVKPRYLHHEFVERNQLPMPDEKLVYSMAGLWRDETRRRKARMGQTDQDSSPFPAEVLVSASADPRNTHPGGWIHEQEFKEKIDMISKEEKAKSDGRKLNFDGFVKQPSYESLVRSSIEAVEDLFPENLAQVLASRAASQAKLATEVPLFDEADIDVDRVFSLKEEENRYEFDEDSAQELELSQSKQDELTNTGLIDNGIGESLMVEGAEPSVTAAEKQKTLQKSSATGFQEPQRQKLPLDLAEIGVRSIGDHTQSDEDYFEVPTEFASDVSGSKQRQVKKRRQTLKPRSSCEFRDCLQTSRPRSRDSAKQLPSNYEKDGLAVMSFESSSKSSPGHINSEASEQQPMKYHDGGNENERFRRKIQTLGPVSQGMPNTKTDRNRSLQFPVVKDPRHPNTILKLSQRSQNLKDSPWKSMPGIRGVLTAQSERVQPELNDEPLPFNSDFSCKSAPSSNVLALLSRLREGLNISEKETIIYCAKDAPAGSELLSDLRKAQKPSILYTDAYYGDEKDVPERSREYAGKEFKLESIGVAFLPDFDSHGTSPATVGEKHAIVMDRISEEINIKSRARACALRIWEIAKRPPSLLDVQNWLARDGKGDLRSLDRRVPSQKTQRKGLSQIEGATQKNSHGFKYTQKQESARVQVENQYMSIMSLEIHVNTRGKMVPDPEQDGISCAFWCFQSNDEDLEINGINEGTHIGILALCEEGGLAQEIAQSGPAQVEEESTELDLVTRMVDIVRKYDPDILAGFEVHGSSWGYMIERARCKYDYNLCDEFSRMTSQSHGRFGKENDKWGFNHTSTIRVTGRHMINIWRAMRGELNLLQYTMENIVFHLLHRRIPHYTFCDLTSWYNSDRRNEFMRVIDYYTLRVQLDLEILEQNELISRTSEQARLLGVDFFSVFSRGSQFKVESLVFRIAKPENFLLPSPSRKQVGQQNALECLPLVMEPQSAFYTSPLLVLDFQSLYPSVMIAYNYCYSTFLGRLVNWRGQNKMGFSEYQREQRLLELFKDQINVAPNGIMYVRPEIRKSLLAKMLGEILETRVMVKSGMKIDKDDKTLQRLLNNRQLALKLIANVTYGYTSASFSGRMPCSEIADSIVQTGRETLEKAIALIHSVGRWGAEVVYGDTDSLFVHLKGRTKDEAFDIGAEIARTISDMNPRPVKLNFEKVYFPCILLAKKRYVGFKYESKTQKEPEFDAKGIETVRRDGTPAEQKIEEKAIKILFKTSDLSQVKYYFQKQCTKVMKGRVSIQDFCFAKEVKLGTYSDRGPPPPGALISTRKMIEDPRAEPQYGERVPYVVITGAPGARLIDRCVAPDVLLYDDLNELDAEYYISKNLIPPLERIFNLVGANVRQWYDEMPKFHRIRQPDTESLAKKKEIVISKRTLELYMKSSSCLVCHAKLEEELSICSKCAQHPDTSLLALRLRQNKSEQRVIDLEKVCRSCANLAWGEDVRCDSRDCPVYYTRLRLIASCKTSRTTAEPVIRFLESSVETVSDW